MFPSLNRMFNSGAFYDLNKLIKKDNEFKLSDYNQTVLDSGIYNNKRYVLPISYKVPSIWTSKGILAKNNMDVDSNEWTWNDFFGEAKKFQDNHIGDNKYFVGGYPFDLKYFMSDICGELVDTKNKETRFNTPEFIGFLKSYKALSATMRSEEKEGFIEPNSQIMINSLGYSEPLYAHMINSVIKQKLAEEGLALRYPSFFKSKLKYAYSRGTVGINSKCKSKERAFGLIKCMLSEKYQSSTSLSGFPVRKKCYENIAKEYASEGMSGLPIAMMLRNNEHVDSVPLPASVAKNVEDLVSDVNACCLIDSRISEIAYNEASLYLKGGKSAEAVAKSIDDKILLYLNE